MVNVRYRNREQARDWADRQLPRLISYWRELPGVAAEIEHWDVGEAQDYIEEWPLYESYRCELEEFDREGKLTSVHKAQLNELRQLVAQHGPLLDRLLGRRRAN